MTPVHRSIRYRIYPDRDQKRLITRTFGCARFVYNNMLQRSIAVYERGKSFCSRNAFNYALTDLKREHPFLYEVDSTALTSANDALTNAFDNFFNKRAGFPRFHRKKDHGSYTAKRIANSQNIAVFDKAVKLPKLGVVKAKTHRFPDDTWRIKSATVSQESDGKYYVSILFAYEKPDSTYRIDPTNAVGLDYASHGLFVTSDGNVGSCHRYYRESQRKLAKAQRKLARKRGYRKGEAKSKNYMKQLRRVNRIHRHIAHQRFDNLHKLSTEIANRYDVVCIEDLDMQAMANKGFGNGKATLDNGYGMFRSFLKYKLEDRGKRLVVVDKWYPSSQICSNCGHKNPLLKDLTIRKWTCHHCGASHDRDVNAAVNILREGLRSLSKETT